MSKHTPGPWHVSRLGQAGYPHVYDESGARVATIEAHQQWSGDPLPFEENANLISAAPELLEALEGLLFGHSTDGHGQYRDDRGELVKETQCLTCAYARAAIRKAKGK